jgi:hypothetical protein
MLGGSHNTFHRHLPHLSASPELEAVEVSLHQTQISPYKSEISPHQGEISLDLDAAELSLDPNAAELSLDSNGNEVFLDQNDALYEREITGDETMLPLDTKAQAADRLKEAILAAGMIGPELFQVYEQKITASFV